MKVLSFFDRAPAAAPADALLYRLVPKRRYDLRSGAAAGDSLTPFAFLADGPAPAPGATAAFAVDDRLEFTRPGAGPGRGGVMRLLFIKRAAGITRAQFADHWRNIHAPLALSMRPSFDHYVTNIVADPASPWDGILQEWFADEHTFDNHDQGLAAHKKAVGDDIPLFVAAVADSPQFLAHQV